MERKYLITFTITAIAIFVVVFGNDSTTKRIWETVEDWRYSAEVGKNATKIYNAKHNTTYKQVGVGPLQVSKGEKDTIYKVIFFSTLYCPLDDPESDSDDCPCEKFLAIVNSSTPKIKIRILAYNQSLTLQENPEEEKPLFVKVSRAISLFFSVFKTSVK